MRSLYIRIRLLTTWPSLIFQEQSAMLTKPHKSHDNIYADILKWCFQAGRVRGHMLSVTTVSRQPRASTPPLLSFLRYDRPTEKTIRKNGSAEKWRKCGIVGNCLRWLRSWGLGKSVAERRAADKNGSAQQCTIWESFGNDDDEIQRYAKTKTETNTKTKKRAADKSGSALQCTIWDRESFRNDEDKIQRHARTKTKTNTKTKRRAADKKQSTAMHYMGSHIATAMHYMGPRILWKWWWSKSSNNFEMQCGLQKVTNWS